MSRCAPGERGVALLVVVLALSMLTALGLALVSVTTTETAIAASYADASQAFYAAESIVDYAIQSLGRDQDWNAVTSGARKAALTDASVLPLLDARDIDGAAVLYAHGWFAELFPPGSRTPRLAVAAWVGPSVTGEELVITGHAYGANGSRRAIQVLAMRPEPAAARLRVVSWREVR